ncbi:17410_t:CDS:1, partial [Funneliformis geosporum]
RRYLTNHIKTHEPNEYIEAFYLHKQSNKNSELTLANNSQSILIELDELYQHKAFLPKHEEKQELWNKEIEILNNNNISFLSNYIIQDYKDDINPYQELVNSSSQLTEKLPNDEICEFASLITKYNISDTLRDQFLSFFRKYSHRSDDPLPKSTKILKNFLDNMKVNNLSFKSEVIYNDGKKYYILYYRPIMEGIRKLLSNPNLVYNEFYVDFKIYNVSFL